MVSYCPKCGNGNQYSVDKPVFCGQCGHKMSSFAIAKPVVKPSKRIIAEEVEETEEGDGESEVIMTFGPEVFQVEPLTAENRGVTLKDIGLQNKIGLTRQKSTRKINLKKEIAKIREQAKGSSVIEMGEEK